MDDETSKPEMTALLKADEMSPRSSLGARTPSGYDSMDDDRIHLEERSSTQKAGGDASIATFYAPVEHYEGRHRFDPAFEWTAQAERQVVRKIDRRICIWICIMFFALQVDRGNIFQALTDNMLDDLGMSTNDYNTGQTIFFACFILAELPSQLISKRLGPDIWLPLQMVAWSLVASLQATLSGRWSFWITRALIGICEGGFIPTVVLYLSYWYNSTELPIRLAFFYLTKELSDMISALVAFGILHMRGTLGIAGWRWLFALEGIITGLIGIASYFYLPPFPTQTASKFRGEKGWFNAEQERIMVNRILRDDPSKGDMHNREALTPSMIWHCLTDYHLWPIYLLGLSWEMPVQPIDQYMTLTLRNAGFDTFTVNLLTIPAYAFWMINLIIITRISERINERFLLAIISQLWILPILVTLEILPASRNHWVVWMLTVLAFAQPYVHAILVGVASRNSGSVRTRAVSAALYNMSIQASNIIGSNVRICGQTTSRITQLTNP